MAPSDSHLISLDEISEFFHGRLGAARASEIRDHIRGCQQCDRLYERMALAEKALYKAGPKAAPPSFQRVSARLFEDAPAKRAALDWRPALGVLVAVSAALMLFVTVSQPRSDEFASRGIQAKLTSELGLRALRVRRGGPEGRIELRDTAEVPLRPSDELKLLYSSAHYRYVSVYLAQDGAILEAIEQIEIKDAVNAKLPGTIRIGSSPAKNTRLIAVFHNGRAVPPTPSVTAMDGPKSAIRVLTSAWSPRGRVPLHDLRSVHRASHVARRDPDPSHKSLRCRRRKQSRF